MGKKTTPNLWEDIQWDRGQGELGALVLTLPVLQQQILQQYYEQGVSLRTIAEKREMSSAKIRRQYDHALFHLRHHPNSTYFRGMKEAAIAYLKAQNDPETPE